MNLDDQLRSALARREPSPGFAERMVARATGRSRRTRVYPVVAWAMAACLLLGAGMEYRRYREGERAREQVLLAMRLAGKEFRTAREKMQRIKYPRALQPVNQESQ